jgi:hypothetical protein
MVALPYLQMNAFRIQKRHFTQTRPALQRLIRDQRAEMQAMFLEGH